MHYKLDHCVPQYRFTKSADKKNTTSFLSVRRRI